MPCSDHRFCVSAGMCGLALLMATGCTSIVSSHEIIVDGGAGAYSATLTLNGESTPMEQIEYRTFASTREVGDASGTIEIIYDGDGATAYCTIENLTPGDGEPHRFVVERGRCREA